MGKVYVPVSEFVSYAYGGDIELRGFVVCASQLVVWNSYMSESNVDVWNIREHANELCIHVETDCECVVRCKHLDDSYTDVTLVSDPDNTYPNVPTANDFLSIALVYS